MPINQDLLKSIADNSFLSDTLKIEGEGALYESPLDNLLDEDLLDLIAALKKNSHIKILNLSANALTDSGIRLLAEDLPPLVEELNISENNIGPDTCVALAKTKLQRIDLSANAVGDAVAAFAASTFLRTFTAFQCGVTDIGAEPLFLSTTISTLDLGHNRITGTCFKGLIHNQVLQNLKLLQNRITEEHCAYLGKNTSLLHLDLTNTFIGDRGASFVAESTSIESISIEQCSIKDAGAIALSQNKKLKRLFLANNHITDAGTKALASNDTVLQLNLARNPISMNALALLKERYATCDYHQTFTRTNDHIDALLKKSVVSLQSSSSFTPHLQSAKAKKNHVEDQDNQNKRPKTLDSAPTNGDKNTPP